VPEPDIPSTNFELYKEVDSIKRNDRETDRTKSNFKKEYLAKYDSAKEKEAKEDWELDMMKRHEDIVDWEMFEEFAIEWSPITRGAYDPTELQAAIAMKDNFFLRFKDARHAIYPPREGISSEITTRQDFIRIFSEGDGVLKLSKMKCIEHVDEPLTFFS
jgi:hypothetical protein